MPRARREAKARLHGPMDAHERMLYMLHGQRDRPEGWRDLWTRNRDELMRMVAHRAGVRPWPFWLVDAGGDPEVVGGDPNLYTLGQDGFFSDEAKRQALWRRRCAWLADHGQLRPGEAVDIVVEWKRRVEDHQRYVNHLIGRGDLPPEYEIDPIYQEAAP